MKVTDLIRFTGSSFGTQCKIYGVDTVFKSWESARRYALVNKSQILAKYNADVTEAEKRNEQEWVYERKMAIARVCVANGYSLKQAWEWMWDATNEQLAAFYELSKTHPKLIRPV